MTLIAVLLVSLGNPDFPDLKYVVDSWTEHASSTESADVVLTIIRDSRRPTFGAPLPEGDGSKVRLRFDRERRQLDAARLTVVRRDGRTQAAESDPDRARVEFRNVLLEEKLKSPQMVPEFEPATLMIDEQGMETGQKLSLLDRLLGEAALRSSQPLRFIDPSRIGLKKGELLSFRLRFFEKQSHDRELEVWIAQTPILNRFQPVRFVQFVGKRPVWQIDVTWTAEEARFPTRYFVQTLNSSGEALEFVEATLASVESPLPASSGIGQLAPNRDQPAPPNPVAVRTRSLARQALDSTWLPVAAIAACVLIIVGRSRRRPAVS